MATIEINGRTWTSALGPNFTDEQIAEMLAWQKQSEHVSPVADPAPPAGLLAAAKAVIANGDEYDQLRRRFGYTDLSLSLLIPRSDIDALRREVEAAPAPVALTEAELQQLADAVPRYRIEDWRGIDPNDVAMNRVNAVLAKLDELGFELRRRA